MFIRNAWYVGAWGTEVGRQTLMRRTLLNEPVVFFRKEDGTPVALEDKCAHRHAPLSEGRLQGDAIECPYHGLQYDETGACVRIPGQSTIPPGCAVRSYPVVQRWGWVWIWPGAISGCGSGWAIRPSPTRTTSRISTGWTTPTGAPRAS